MSLCLRVRSSLTQEPELTRTGHAKFNQQITQRYPIKLRHHHVVTLRVHQWLKAHDPAGPQTNTPGLHDSTITSSRIRLHENDGPCSSWTRHDRGTLTVSIPFLPPPQQHRGPQTTPHGYHGQARDNDNCQLPPAANITNNNDEDDRRQHAITSPDHVAHLLHRDVMLGSAALHIPTTLKPPLFMNPPI